MPTNYDIAMQKLQPMRQNSPVRQSDLAAWIKADASSGNDQSATARFQNQELSKWAAEDRKATRHEKSNSTLISAVIETVKTSLRGFFQGIVKELLPELFSNNDISTATKVFVRRNGGELGWESSNGGGLDYDKIYIGGIEYPADPSANPQNYDFIQIGGDGSYSFIQNMISPMPTGYEIYNIRKNHIHITGATAGNL